MKLRILNSCAPAAAMLLIASCDVAHSAPQNVHMGIDSIRADSVARARVDSIDRAAPGYVIDSVLPAEEEMRRFRSAIGGAPATHLQGSSASREELVQRFVRDIARQDTSDLRLSALSAREFIDLVYPSSPNTHAPYRQSPAFVWMQIGAVSDKGLTRALRRRGGLGLAYEGHACVRKPEVQGINRLWTGCTVRLVSPSGDTTTQRLFGAILEREGRFKFVSFANQF